MQQPFYLENFPLTFQVHFGNFQETYALKKAHEIIVAQLINSDNEHFIHAQVFPKMILHCKVSLDILTWKQKAKTLDCFSSTFEQVMTRPCLARNEWFYKNHRCLSLLLKPFLYWIIYTKPSAAGNADTFKIAHSFFYIK